MEEMEYVKYYCNHLLDKAIIDKEEYVFNDISLIDDGMAESNAEKYWMNCKEDT